jgi:hypothetical protein
MIYDIFLYLKKKYNFNQTNISYLSRDRSYFI